MQESESLKELDLALRSIAGSDREDFRPFVCRGNPLNCQVLVVGINAKNPVGSFFDYWSATDGFDLAKFDIRYKQIYKRKSITRQNMELLSAAIERDMGLSCIETNVFQFASKNFSSLPVDDKQSDALKLLIAHVPVKAIIAHGLPNSEAQKRLDELLRAKALPLKRIAHLSQAPAEVKSIVAFLQQHVQG